MERKKPMVDLSPEGREDKDEIYFSFFEVNITDGVRAIGEDSSFVVSEAAKVLVEQALRQEIVSHEEQLKAEAEKQRGKVERELREKDIKPGNFEAHPGFQHLPEARVEIVAPSSSDSKWQWKIIVEKKPNKKNVLEQGEFDVPGITNFPLKVKNSSEPHIRIMTEEEAEASHSAGLV